ncbi:hypothetical protein SLNSH_22695 [Alsobacter soli]|uniref:Uncharacterized protein n=1 Tax=Alsobacter soli TaxID=2109933 RepID=A0A2T1HLZ2_9HYPH|nr:hypothetical protein [Alsobacter soli]PSC02674.1 hypothetical protein SLNSH_22695 [Alsobacter soli]
MFSGFIDGLLEYAKPQATREEKLARMLEAVGWLRDETVYFGEDDEDYTFRQMDELALEIRARAQLLGGEPKELLLDVASLIAASMSRKN